jgi:hypothetical protein
MLSCLHPIIWLNLSASCCKTASRSSRSRKSGQKLAISSCNNRCNIIRRVIKPRRKILAKALGIQGEFLLRGLGYRGSCHFRLARLETEWECMSRSYGEEQTVTRRAYTFRCVVHVLDSLDLDECEWLCPHRGAHHDRDINAAKSVLAKGLTVSACGGDVRPDLDGIREGSHLGSRNHGR